MVRLADISPYDWGFVGVMRIGNGARGTLSRYLYVHWWAGGIYSSVRVETWL